MNVKRNKAYSLVEVLIVMSIIGVLISFILGGAQIARDRAKKVRVHALFDAIGAGLRLYNDSFLTYPPDDEFYRSGVTIAALSSSEALYVHMAATYKRGINASIFAGPMIVFEPDMLQDSRNNIFDIDGDGAIDDSTMVIIDAWGIPIRYRFPPNSNRTYDLWSYGPDRTNNNGYGDDINNWE